MKNENIKNETMENIYFISVVATFFIVLSLIGYNLEIHNPILMWLKSKSAFYVFAFFLSAISFGSYFKNKFIPAFSSLIVIIVLAFVYFVL